MPAGYLALCQATPRICNFEKSGRRRGDRAMVMRMNAARFRQLEAITQSVNRSMRSVEDRARFGVSDRWTVGGSAGDCEDFALTKRALLIARGWPAEAVLIALVVARGRSHAVLVARTDAGDYVLDNLTSVVKPWRTTPYSWQEIQAPDAFAWRAL
jgi:predicted transglutaminase-like cysteine proteinase